MEPSSRAHPTPDSRARPQIFRGPTSEDVWPPLPLKEWKATYQTLHLWLQIVGKIRLTLSPPINHWWHSALYVTPRGLETSSIPYSSRTFNIRLDFIDHFLEIETSDGEHRAMALAPRTVADFYQELMSLLASLDIFVKIQPLANELPEKIRLDRDTEHSSYDPDAAHRHWLILVQVDRILKEFRSGFTGKCSPVHFFWGSFDMATTFFSGRRAPARPEADAITREAYSDEVVSFGFWPGSGNVEDPAFYAYQAPEAKGFASSKIEPAEAFYNPPTHGFVLMYDDVRDSKDPDRKILEFFRSVYSSARKTGDWPELRGEKKPTIH